MRSIRYIALSIILVASSPGHAADLLEVYQQAIGANPDLAAAAEGLNAVRERRIQARGGLLPTLSASGEVSRKRSKSLNQSSPATESTNKSASLDLTQPLFRYDRWIGLKKADYEIAAATADYAAAQQDLIIEVAERYFNVLDAQDNLEFAEAEKSAISRQLDQASQRFEVGLIAITDVKAAQARYDISVSDEIRAISELVETRDALRQTTGEYYEQLAVLNPNMELVKPSPDSAKEWIATAQKQNLKILAAEATSESARYTMRIARASHLPTLDLNASASYVDRNPSGNVPFEVQDNEIGVRLVLPIYQGGQVNSQSREARSRFNQATQQLRVQIRATEFETRNAFRGVLTDISQVNALARTVESTKIALEGEEAGHEVGTRTIVDVLNAQREYFLAKLNHSRGRYQYAIDQLLLKRAAGILSQKDLEELNRSLTN